MESTMKDLLEQQQVSLRYYFDQQLQIQLESIERKISSSLQTSNESVAKELQGLNTRLSHLENYCYSAMMQAQEAKQQVASVSDRLDSVYEEIDSKIDKLEAFSRRDNLRFFNVSQSHEERYEECTKLALDLVKEAVPDIDWRQNDIQRAHRIGKYSPNQFTPKPLIVKFSNWSDKMAILTRGKQNLKKMGITVAGDLTERQRREIEEHRRQGVHAYYRGNRLVVDGPIRGRGNYNRGGRDNNRYEPDYDKDLHSHGINEQWRHQHYYQPWSTSHFPLLPRRPHAQTGANVTNLHQITRQGDAGQRADTGQTAEETVQTVNSNSERQLQNQSFPSSLPLCHQNPPPTPSVSLCQQFSSTHTAETILLPISTPTTPVTNEVLLATTTDIAPLPPFPPAPAVTGELQHAVTPETAPLPHSPPVSAGTVELLAVSSLESAPLPISSPASVTIGNQLVVTTETAPLPHSPSATMNSESQLAVTAETAPIPQSPPVTAITDDITPSPHSPPTTAKQQNEQKKSPPEKTARRLRNKSVSSTEGKRQLTINESVSQQKGKKHEKSKANEK